MKYSLAIHGGAGTILPESMTREKEQAYLQGLKDALQIGEQILIKNGSALDAVEAAVKVLEDNPLFNAGRGAVFTHDKTHEMDASIMCGKSITAGAVAGVKNIKNPVSLARKVMEKTEHVMLCGEGAMNFAKLINTEIMPDDYFYSEERYQQLHQALAEDIILLDHYHKTNDKKFGTVGAVALDTNGNLAAATSTGGMTNKKFGRVGDSPIIGAGTYANNAKCAVSCTGHGEYFIKSVVAYDVFCLMEYKQLSLEQACHLVVNTKLKNIGGEGGLIAIDKEGNISMPFNSIGMYRGMLSHNKPLHVAIYK
ncbi:MAG: isoaspartyl peptidase/L-asparaginase [Bacteroidia bacterium]|nr:isoaspartyl peptidase/L-asparaginase [Bacteroidia bacterium]MCZ2247896.1 isoaspartyl peptidase/L-asparaginase [Bacteroidia bacterium]